MPLMFLFLASQRTMQSSGQALIIHSPRMKGTARRGSCGRARVGRRSDESMEHLAFGNGLLSCYCTLRKAEEPILGRARVPSWDGHRNFSSRRSRFYILSLPFPTSKARGRTRICTQVAQRGGMVSNGL